MQLSMLAMMIASSDAGRVRVRDEAVEFGFTGASPKYVACGPSFPRKYASLNSQFKSVRLVGEGANACVYLAKEPKHGNRQIAVKIAHTPTELYIWEDECKKAQRVNAAACQAGSEAVKFAETYLATCIDVGGTDDAPFLIMHAVQGDALARNFEHNLECTACLRPRPQMSEQQMAKICEKHCSDALQSTAEQKSIFAQIVGAISSMHSVGYSHNDLHTGNILVSSASTTRRVSFVDFDEVAPLSFGVYDGSYKQDATVVAMQAALLAGCSNDAQTPIQPENLSQSHRKRRKAALFACLKDKWAVDSRFIAALEAVIDEANDHAESTRVQKLFRTSFIQRNLPAFERPYKHDCGSLKRMLALDSAADSSPECARFCDAREDYGGCHGFACIKGPAQGGCSNQPWVVNEACKKGCDCSAGK